MNELERQKQISDLLLSKNFTIAFHDNGYCSLYEGKHEYEDLPENAVETFWMSNQNEGYAPVLIVMLIEALNGKTVSI